MNRFTGIVIILLLLVSLPCMLLDYAHFPYSDGAEHGAAVRALAQNLIHPGDPMLPGGGAGSPRYVPSIMLMALAMRLLDADVIIILKLFLILYSSLFLVSAAIFSKDYFNDTGQAPWTIACLLFLWGFGWTGANAYMFSAILAGAYFPSVVSFSIALLAFHFHLRFLQDKKYRFLVAALVLGGICFVNHPPTGVFFFVGAGLLYWEKAGLHREPMVYYITSVAVALFCAAVWPYYSFFSTVIKIASGSMAQTGDYILTRHYLYSEPLLRCGAALAGIPLIVWYMRRKQYFFLWAGFLIFTLLYLAGYYLNVSFAERCIFFIVFFLQLSFSRGCRQLLLSLVGAPAVRIKKLASAFIIVLLTGGAVIQLALIGKEFIYPAVAFTTGSILPRYSNPNRMQFELRKYLQDGDVVLSDIYSSWFVPVYTGAKIIALYHSAPYLRDNEMRIADVEKFYKATTTSGERLEILKKYGVSHIFLHFKIDGKDLVPALKHMGLSVTARTDTFCIVSGVKQLLSG